MRCVVGDDLVGRTCLVIVAKVTMAEMLWIFFSVGLRYSCRSDNRWIIAVIWK